MSSQSTDPIVSPHQVVAAGAASATAAGVTSTFGVAGTLIGAALTAMIITGGSAILKAYLENATGTIKHMPDKLRATANRRKAGRGDDAPPTLPDNPKLRNNFMGRMRGSLGWFSRLPTTRRRSILMKGLIASLVAFVIAMGVVTAAEKGIGNSLSCGFWGNCPAGASPGAHFGETRGTGAGSSVSFGRPEAAPATGGDVQQDGTPAPSGGGGSDSQPVDPADPAQPAPGDANPAPEEQPVEPPPEEPAPVEPTPEEPAPVEPAPEEPVTPETPTQDPASSAEEAPVQE